MTNCLIGLPAENWARAGIVTASAEVSGLGAGNVQTDQGATSTAWQTPAGTTSAWLQVDAFGARSWGALGLFATNLTPDATVRWRLSDDATFAASTYDSGVLTSTVAAGYRQSVHVPTAAVTARHMRCDIADATNPEALIRVALVFAGAVRRPVRNLGYDSAVRRTADRGAVTTRGGQVFFDLRHVRRAWSVSLPSLTAAEVWPLAMEIQRAAEPGGNLLFVPFPAGADLSQEAVFGPLVEAAPVTWPAQTPVRRAWSFTIEERL
jgi:hypothetical protein